MSEFHNMTPEEQKIFHLEVMQMYQGVQIRLLEELLAEVYARVGGTVGGKNLEHYLATKRDDAFRMFLASMADEFPDRASEISRFFDFLRKKDSR